MVVVVHVYLFHKHTQQVSQYAWLRIQSMKYYIILVVRAIGSLRCVDLSRRTTVRALQMRHHAVRWRQLRVCVIGGVGCGARLIANYVCDIGPSCKYKRAKWGHLHQFAPHMTSVTNCSQGKFLLSKFDILYEV